MRDDTAHAGPGLLTVGHGTLGRDALTQLLAGAGIETLVDVRRYPGSRANADVRREAMAEWLPEAGIEYRWEERLGGRRSLPRASLPVDSWWTVRQFAAYASHTRDDDFRTALDELLDHAASTRTAVMCSEAVWWRCHRRLIADVAVLVHGTHVVHLMHDGRIRPHPVAAGARLGDDGDVYWDAG